MTEKLNLSIKVDSSELTRELKKSGGELGKGLSESNGKKGLMPDLDMGAVGGGMVGGLLGAGMLAPLMAPLSAIGDMLEVPMKILEGLLKTFLVLGIRFFFNMLELGKHAFEAESKIDDAFKEWVFGWAFPGLTDEQIQNLLDEWEEALLPPMIPTPLNMADWFIRVNDAMYNWIMKGLVDVYNIHKVIWNSIKNVREWLFGAGDSTYNLFTEAWNVLKNVHEWLFGESNYDLISDVWDTLSDPETWGLVSAPFNLLQEIWNIVIGFIKDNVPSISGAGKNVLEGLGFGGDGFLGNVEGVVGKLGSGFRDVLKVGVEPLYNKLLGNSLFPELLSTQKGIPAVETNIRTKWIPAIKDTITWTDKLNRQLDHATRDRSFTITRVIRTVTKGGGHSASRS